MDKQTVIDRIEEIKSVLNNDTKIDEFNNRGFQETDADQSGEVCLKEFYTIFALIVKELDLPEPSQDEVQNQFNELDTDKSGRLNKQEFRVFTINLLTLIQSKLESLLAQMNN